MSTKSQSQDTALFFNDFGAYISGEHWEKNKVLEDKLFPEKKERLDHSKISWWLRQILWIGSLINPDPEARKDERHGFDYVDKESIEPILKLVRQFKHSEVPV